MKKTLRIGHIDLSFHAASAALVCTVFEKYGWQVEMTASPHEEMFKRYGKGEVDMLVSAWLPASHEMYLAPFLDKTVKLATLYHPYCIWGVPDYIPEEDVSSIDDLLKPEVLPRMVKRIQGINPGAGISRFSRAIMEEYGLGNMGYHFQNGSEEECYGTFERGISEKRWFVIPLWHPQFLHHRYVIRALLEPKGLLGGQDEATLIASQSVVNSFEPELLAELRSLSPGNAAISELDYQICRKGMTPRQAVQLWSLPSPVDKKGF